MNRCKDCKYFKHEKEYSDKYGECTSEKFVYGDSLDIVKYQNATDMLFYMDYEWYKAYVEVGEDFGCIHFKSKGEE